MPNPTTTKTEDQDKKVSTDWPEELPIMEVELDLLEEHLLDILTTMIQHG